MTRSAAQRAVSSGGERTTLHELLAIGQRVDGALVARHRERQADRAPGPATASGSMTTPRGMEFAGVRAYQVTDDARRIDWRHTARHGRPFTKVFQPEAARAAFYVVDLGPDMQFGTQVALKSVQAARATAALAWAAAKAGDPVGGLVCSAGRPVPVPPRGREAGLIALFRAMADAFDAAVPESAGPTDLAAGLDSIAAAMRPGTELSVVSDFRGLDARLEKSLRRLAARVRLHLVRIFDRIECVPPPPGIYRLSAGGQEACLDLHREAVRQAWVAAFAGRSAYLARLGAQVGATVSSLSTADDPVDVLRARDPG
jgi:uncharacterized protein (DUF58 family)